MKLFIKKLLREGLLTEKLTDVDSDVNLIYDRYFKDDVDQIQLTGVVTKDMFKKGNFNTNILKSELSIKANELNNCDVLVNYGQNYYKPSANLISVSVNMGAFELLVDNNINLDNVGNYLNDKQAKAIVFEFSEAKIKGSIHHELVHWINDTINNRYINKRLTRAGESGKNISIKKPVNAEKFEIQAQIHNIKQLYNKYNQVWDNLSFEDMVSYSPPLSSVMNNLTGDIKNRWIRDIKTRMYREGLLGKKMYN
jgi:hypothetical protein